MSIKEIFRSYAKFDAEGRHVWGTDRESNHRYGDAYESLVDRDASLMLEVGVADGSSLFAWREVFPCATIVGLDLQLPSFGREPQERIEFHQGDATVRQVCEVVVAGRFFDLVVDDASHQVPEVLTTLLWLWPSVRPGGLYVIEDLHPTFCSYFVSLLGAQIVDTTSPFGFSEPLIVLRKPV